MQVPVEPAAPEDAVIAALISIGRLMKSRLTDSIDPSTHLLLHRLRCGGALRVTDLAAASRLDTSTVSRHVAALEKQGLVVRSQHPDDGRAQAVALTDAGRAALDQAIAVRRQLMVDLLADWPRADVEQLASLLTTFAADADARSHTLDDTSIRTSELEHA